MSRIVKLVNRPTPKKGEEASVSPIKRMDPSDCDPVLRDAVLKRVIDDNDEMTPPEAGKLLGVDHRTLALWVYKFQNNIPPFGKRPSIRIIKAKKPSTQMGSLVAQDRDELEGYLKLMEARERGEEGLSAAEVALKLNVHHSQVFQWYNKWKLGSLYPHTPPVVIRHPNLVVIEKYMKLLEKKEAAGNEMTRSEIARVFDVNTQQIDDWYSDWKNGQLGVNLAQPPKEVAGVESCSKPKKVIVLPTGRKLRSSKLFGPLLTRYKNTQFLNRPVEDTDETMDSTHGERDMQEVVDEEGEAAAKAISQDNHNDDEHESPRGDGPRPKFTEKNLCAAHWDMVRKLRDPPQGETLITQHNHGEPGSPREHRTRSKFNEKDLCATHWNMIKNVRDHPPGPERNKLLNKVLMDLGVKQSTLWKWMKNVPNSHERDMSNDMNTSYETEGQEHEHAGDATAQARIHTARSSFNETLNSASVALNNMSEGREIATLMKSLVDQFTQVANNIIAVVEQSKHPLPKEPLAVTLCCTKCKKQKHKFPQEDIDVEVYEREWDNQVGLRMESTQLGTPIKCRLKLGQLNCSRHSTALYMYFHDQSYYRYHFRYFIQNKTKAYYSCVTCDTIKSDKRREKQKNPIVSRILYSADEPILYSRHHEDCQPHAPGTEIRYDLTRQERKKIRVAELRRQGIFPKKKVQTEIQKRNRYLRDSRKRAELRKAKEENDANCERAQLKRGSLSYKRMIKAIRDAEKNMYDEEVEEEPEQELDSNDEDDNEDDYEKEQVIVEPGQYRYSY